MGPFFQDTAELSRRLLSIMICFIVFFIGCFYCSERCFLGILYPFRKAFSLAPSLIVTQWGSSVWTPIYVALFCAGLLIFPVILFHIAKFLTPGLYQKERVWFYIMLWGGVFLFLLGVFFCYFLILPGLFRLCAWMLPKGVMLWPELLNTCEFILRFLMLFGLAFQLPLVCLSLLKYKKVTLEQLILFRPYMIVGSFIVGMLLTPPDVFAQMMLAFPLWGLYELSLLGGRFFLLFFD